MRRCAAQFHERNAKRQALFYKMEAMENTVTIVKNSFAARCRAEGKAALLSEWDSARNDPLTPEQVSAESHKKVWWRCASGHTWQTEVRIRFRGAQCPYCTHHRLSRGGNDLATLAPELAAQWDPVKNGALTPADVLPGSSRYVFWRCEKGHSWRARICARSRGSGCPICDGKTVVPGENDLRTVYPELAAEWNAERNGQLTPADVTAYSNRKVWWRCALGHEWQAVIASRATIHSGCPYCTGKRVLAGFNDLATLYPALAAQWDTQKNGTLTPEQVTPGSHKKVWWRCGEGHEWKAVVYSRTGNQGYGCPICAGRTARKRGHVG